MSGLVGRVEQLLERVERVFTAYAEMDALHKSMYPSDGGPPDEQKKLRADGLCLGLADSAFVLAEAVEPLARDWQRKTAALETIASRAQRIGRSGRMTMGDLMEAADIARAALAASSSPTPERTT